MEELKEIPTIVLIHELSKADKEDNQQVVNICAFELARRIYVPNSKITFKSILDDLGYKKIDHQKKLKR